MARSAVHASRCDGGAPWLQAQEDKLASILNRKKSCAEQKCKTEMKAKNTILLEGHQKYEITILRACRVLCLFSQQFE